MAGVDDWVSPAADDWILPQQPVTATGLAKQVGAGVAENAFIPGTLGNLQRYIASLQSPESQQKLEAARSKYGALLPTRQQMEDATGIRLPEPQNTAEEYARSVGAFLPSAAFGGGGALARAANVVVPAVTSETAGQLTKGTALEPAARVSTALATGKITAPKAAEAAIPAIEDVKAAARAGYQAPEVAAVQIKPSAVAGLAAQIENDLTRAGFRPTSKSASDTFAEVRDLRPPQGVQSVSVADLDTARKALSNLSREVDAVGKPTAEAVAAGKAVGHIDNFLPNLNQADLLAGDAAQANSILSAARGNWKSAKQAELAATKMENARIQAASTYGGGNINNALRQAYRPLEVNNYAKTSNWSPAAQSALQDVVEGALFRNAMRDIGRSAPTGPVNIGMHLAAGAPTAFATGGASIPVSLGVGAATYLAKKLGEAGTKKAAQRLTQTLLKESPLYQARLSSFGPITTPRPYLGGLLGSLASLPAP